MNLLFKLGIRKNKRLNIPVISVGNLTFGGTGKTPFVDFLIGYLIRKGKNPLVVSRAYKAKAKTPIRVESNTPDVYGDEPCLLYQHHPDVPIFVGRVKSEIAAFAGESGLGNVIILDDGFQHVSLFRNFNILLIDASRPIGELSVFPFGRGRESVKNISRCDFLVFTKVNSLPKEYENLFFKKLEYKGGWALSNIVLTEPISLIEYLKRDLADYKNNFVKNEFPKNINKILAVCGIASPHSFLDFIQKNFQAEVRSLQFADHHPYSKNDFFRIQKEAESFDLILTTEKDALKWKQIPCAEKVWVLPLKMKFIKGEAGFHEALDLSIR